jgi:hypothetical protein
MLMLLLQLLMKLLLLLVWVELPTAVAVRKEAVPANSERRGQKQLLNHTIRGAEPEVMRTLHHRPSHRRPCTATIAVGDKAQRHEERIIQMESAPTVFLFIFLNLDYDARPFG